MSLNWQWNDKMGECIYDNGHTANLYRGNALTIAINEFEDKTYSLAWFACDTDHMKNMLGLNKGTDNCFKNFGIDTLKLNTKYKETETIIKLLAKSRTPIKIELY